MVEGPHSDRMRAFVCSRSTTPFSTERAAQFSKFQQTFRPPRLLSPSQAVRVSVNEDFHMLRAGLIAVLLLGVGSTAMASDRFSVYVGVDSYYGPSYGFSYVDRGRGDWRRDRYDRRWGYSRRYDGWGHWHNGRYYSAPRGYYYSKPYYYRGKAYGYSRGHHGGRHWHDRRHHDRHGHRH
jgi:hypothetical protein